VSNVSSTGNVTTYTTVSGDMWDTISYALTGSHAHTEAIMKANPQYADVYIFSGGVVLTIPDLDSIVSYDDMPPWKE